MVSQGGRGKGDQPVGTPIKNQRVFIQNSTCRKQKPSRAWVFKRDARPRDRTHLLSCRFPYQTDNDSRNPIFKISKVFCL